MRVDGFFFFFKQFCMMQWKGTRGGEGRTSGHHVPLSFPPPGQGSPLHLLTVTQQPCVGENKPSGPKCGSRREAWPLPHATLSTVTPESACPVAHGETGAVDLLVEPDPQQSRSSRPS